MELSLYVQRVVKEAKFLSRLIKFYKLKYTIITSRLHSRLFIILFFFYFKVNYISHRLFFYKNVFFYDKCGKCDGYTFY